LLHNDKLHNRERNDYDDKLRFDTARLSWIEHATMSNSTKIDWQAPIGHNPYSSADTPMAPKPPRRTLDDMRRLSEEIKHARERQDRLSQGRAP
jgi:hypothetical protein